MAFHPYENRKSSEVVLHWRGVCFFFFPPLRSSTSQVRVCSVPTQSLSLCPATYPEELSSTEQLQFGLSNHHSPCTNSCTASTLRVLWRCFGSKAPQLDKTSNYFWPPKIGTEYSVPTSLLLPEWSTFCVSSHTYLAALSPGPELILSGIAGICSFGVLQLKTLKNNTKCSEHWAQGTHELQGTTRGGARTLWGAEQVEIPCGNWHRKRQPSSEQSWISQPHPCSSAHTPGRNWE